MVSRSMCRLLAIELVFGILVNFELIVFEIKCNYWALIN